MRQVESYVIIFHSSVIFTTDLIVVDYCRVCYLWRFDVRCSGFVFRDFSYNSFATLSIHSSEDEVDTFL